MKRIARLLLFLAASAAAHAQTAPPPQSKPIAFTHVTVIDATGAAAQPEMTVIIRGDRITGIGKNVSLPKDAQVVDATGKFLIPGLWDMHIHVRREDELTLLVANGVTGIRIMGGTPAQHEMRTRIDAGKELGPRMAIASRLMDGPGPGKIVAPVPGDTAGEADEHQAIENGGLSRPEIVTNAADAQAAVARAKQAGADFIKIHSDLSRDAYFALVAESKKQGFQFVGHLPTGVSAAEASDAGQRSIEHAMGYATGCTSREAELRAATLDAQSKPPQERAPLMLAVQRMTLASYSADACNALAKKFVQNQTWQCPTLISLLGGQGLSALNAGILQYEAAPMRATWQQQLAGARKPSSEQQEVSEKLDDQVRQEVALMQHAGVRFLSGTDAVSEFRVAGFDLHFELEQLNKAGLTPMEVIQSATRNPAVFLGKDKDLGTIQKGKLADVVLLDANPLDQITNTRKIDAVVVNGRLLDRKTLDSLLAHVEADSK